MHKQVPITLATGVSVALEIDVDGTGAPYFVLGIRKCGSTLLNKICTVLAAANSVNYVDVAGAFFKRDIPAGDWLGDPALKSIVRPGNAYGGFRNMPVALADTPGFGNARKVLLVRDPRDALVSEYFSNAYSHAIPAAGDNAAGTSARLKEQRRKALESTADVYVRERVRAMRRTFLEYADTWAGKRVLTLRYEDVIFRKTEMIERILTFFRWKCEEEAIAKLLADVDVRPATEDPKAFIRRVTPGDHLEKLSPETIEIVNRELAEVLTLFGYAT